MPILISSSNDGDAVSPAAHLGGYLWLIATTTVLGGWLIGYEWVVTGGAAPFYEKFFTLLNSEDKGWAQSSWAWDG